MENEVPSDWKIQTNISLPYWFFSSSAWEKFHNMGYHLIIGNYSFKKWSLPDWLLPKSIWDTNPSLALVADIQRVERLIAVVQKKIWTILFFC